jgi:putative transposase
MPFRKAPIVNGEIYHVFNRSIARQPVFESKRDYERFLDILRYYRFFKPPLSYSHFFRLNSELRQKYLLELNVQKPICDVFVFCLMPNHFHLLLKQATDNGITNLLSNIQNSYARYFNTKYKRNGALFQEMFKAVRVETDEQFVHVARYIHLNPLNGFLLKSTKELGNYTWTSFADYVNTGESKILTKDLLLGFHQNREKLKKFTFDQLDYQRKLHRIKHLVFDS